MPIYNSPKGLADKLIEGGMNPNTPINAPSHSVWVKDNEGWKLHSGRDGEEGFNRLDYLDKYKNAMLTKNGQTPEEKIKEMNDYELFKSIYYPAWARGRDNYLEGEEEGLWNSLNEYFDLGEYEPASKENNYSSHTFLVNPNEKTVFLKKGNEQLPLVRR